MQGIMLYSVFAEYSVYYTEHGFVGMEYIARTIKITNADGAFDHGPRQICILFFPP